MPCLLELFCGSKSVGKVFEKEGWDVISLDIEKKFDPTICIDFMDWDYKSVQNIDCIWASPDCACYSLASGGRHFDAERKPKTDKCIKSLKILDKVKECINYHLSLNNNIIYFIENPRARMRWFMEDYPRYTVAYCQYGLSRMKPTDIWTNTIGFEPKMCKNNNPDCNHIRAPRGSKTGTQSCPRSERAIIPEQLICDLYNTIPTK